MKAVKTPEQQKQKILQILAWNPRIEAVDKEHVLDLMDRGALTQAHNYVLIAAARS